MGQASFIGLWGFIFGLLGTEAISADPDSLAFEIREMKDNNGRLLERWQEILDHEGKYIQHGEYNQWHENGNLKLMGSYKKGKKDGRWFSYDEKGSLRFEASFKL
jgi:antitoxin component YwqK of YwqJK toxin-antitoxin module